MCLLLMGGSETIPPYGEKQSPFAFNVEAGSFELDRREAVWLAGALAGALAVSPRDFGGVQLVTVVIVVVALNFIFLRLVDSLQLPLSTARLRSTKATKGQRIVILVCPHQAMACRAKECHHGWPSKWQLTWMSRSRGGSG